MADERFVVMTVECQHCKTKQKVHVAARTKAHSWTPERFYHQLSHHFRVTVSAQIVAGPFPV